MDKKVEGTMTLEEQVDMLAIYILHEVDGEPSKNEGAIECAIRIMRESKSESQTLREWIGEDVLNEKSGFHEVALKERMMRVELTEHPKGNQRFEILLGEMVYVISLEEGKQLADWIYELHPTADTRGEHAEVFEGSGMMPYTLEGMKNYYAENKQDYLAPILHDAIEKIAQLEEENEACDILATQLATERDKYKAMLETLIENIDTLFDAYPEKMPLEDAMRHWQRCARDVLGESDETE